MKTHLDFPLLVAALSMAAAGCSSTDAGTVYTVSVAVSGLAGSGLVLQNSGGDDLAAMSNGTLRFATLIANGSSYTVTVAKQPYTPNQTCVVADGSGVVERASPPDVRVTCLIDIYYVKAFISGLSGPGLVLRNNDDENMSVAANGWAQFSTAIADENAYAITVEQQPAGQACVVNDGYGMVASADVVSIAVRCHSSAHRGAPAHVSGTPVLRNTKRKLMRSRPARESRA